MFKQICQLTRLGMYSLFHINELRHTKDLKKKRRFILLGIVWLILALMILFYMALLSFSYIKIGLADVLPMYFYTVASMIILFFSLFKAGDMMFSMKSYEIQASWPVSVSAIVAGRFALMYTTNLLFSLFVMLPGMGIYGWVMRPAVSFYIYGVFGLLFLPVLPLCIALIAGAVIRAIGSRMKHKGVGIALLTLIFALIPVAASMLLSRNAESMDMAELENMAFFVTETLKKIYPPAWIYGNGVVKGEFAGILGLCAGSTVLFIGFVFILRKYFMDICSLLNSASAKNNYKLENQRQNPVLKALWQRELRRYFTSSTYISNTMIGYIFMVLVSAALLFYAPERLEAMLGIPGLVKRVWPLALGFMPAMMPTTSSSISMEGKNLWRLQSLPLSDKKIYDAKILLNLSLAAPFYILAVILSMIALRPGLINGLFIICVPAVYILFSAVAGLSINMALPLLQWESEVQVVKQSGAAFISMLTAFIVGIVPIGILLVFQKLSAGIVFLAVLIVLSGLTFILYIKNQRKALADYS